MRTIIIRASYDSKFETVDFRNSKAYLEMPDNVKLNAITQLIDELLIEKGACVEFRFCAGVWYIISSDGLKQS